MNGMCKKYSLKNSSKVEWDCMINENEKFTVIHEFDSQIIILGTCKGTIYILNTIFGAVIQSLNLSQG